ncbi:MAG: SMP-30/gluconolactonase/LRE family protein [Microthrixaceae bacterium]
MTEVVFPLDGPNGIGLSPAGDRVYVAETYTGRLWAWDVDGPGSASGSGLMPPHGDLLHAAPAQDYFDSLGVDGDGNVCVATIQTGGYPWCLPMAAADSRSCRSMTWSPPTSASAATTCAPPG